MRVALPSNVHAWLKEGVDYGQRSFTNCEDVDAGKERQVLFRDKKGLKVQDAKGKTLAKSDGTWHAAERRDTDSGHHPAIVQPFPRLRRATARPPSLASDGPPLQPPTQATRA